MQVQMNKEIFLRTLKKYLKFCLKINNSREEPLENFTQIKKDVNKNNKI